MLEANTSTQAAFLISIIGITNAISRLVFGWIADKPFVNKTVLVAAACSVIGIIMACFPISSNYGFLAVNAAIFGIFFGEYYGCLIIFILAHLAEGYVVNLSVLMSVKNT